MGSLVRPLLEPRCSLSLMPIESDASEDKRQHMNNKNHRAKKICITFLLQMTLSSLRTGQQISASAGEQTSSGRREVRSLLHGCQATMSRSCVTTPAQHLSLCHARPCCNLHRRQSLPRASSRSPAQLSLWGGTSSSSSSRIVSLFLTPVTVSPFNPHL